MTSIEKKILMAKDKEFDLTKSEVKKVYAAAKKANKGKVPELTGWFTAGADENGWYAVECEICDALTGDRLDNVVINCWVVDRRNSFVSAYNPYESWN